MNVCFFKKNIIYENHVCPFLSGLFPLVYWFVNLTDKHGPKIYRDLSVLGVLTQDIGCYFTFHLHNLMVGKLQT